MSQALLVNIIDTDEQCGLLGGRLRPAFGLGGRTCIRGELGSGLIDPAMGGTCLVKNAGTAVGREGEQFCAGSFHALHAALAPVVHNESFEPGDGSGARVEIADPAKPQFAQIPLFEPLGQVDSDGEQGLGFLIGKG